mmetsp:Transcript_44424/g.117579  ORF Transcript_44424/g.117579 Transcript_44424/m.117579 type:complete len:990 (-) Transcript_44424:511-3480(-)
MGNATSCACSAEGPHSERRSMLHACGSTDEPAPTQPVQRRGDEGEEEIICRSPGVSTKQVDSAEFFKEVSERTALVYIERLPANDARSIASTTDGLSSRQSDISSRMRTKAMSMMQTTGLGVLAMLPGNLDKTRLASFREKLRLAGIDTTRWGIGGAKSIEHLFWEAYEQRGCIFTGIHLLGRLKRVTRLVKIRLVAEIYGVDHVLFSRMQFLHDGRTVERKQVPLRKLQWNSRPDEEFGECTEELYDEVCPYVENWQTGCRKTLEERLGLTQAWQAKHLVEDLEAYRYTTEDDVRSAGYPGLTTLYCIHEVSFRVRDPACAGVQVIGLPEGNEFATAEGDFNFHSQQDDDGLAIGTQLNIWAWGRESCTTPPGSGDGTGTHGSRTSGGSPRPSTISRVSRKGRESRILRDGLPPRRVPQPAMALKVTEKMEERMRQDRLRPPSNMLWASMEGMRTDWPRVKRIAAQILDPKYTLHRFNADLSAFPELNLYLLDDRMDDGAGSELMVNTKMSSGRSIGDEYQRTIGAFFAIYWMMRLDIDGKEGFTNGVDDHWKPLSITDEDDIRVSQADKRINFMKNAQWDFFRTLLMNAGLLEEKKSSSFFKSATKIQVNEQRLESLLALTAIHDIMKMNVLLPVVQKEHEPYRGYVAGDTIGDHDHALSYIMEYYPEMLPSFRELEPEEKRGVQLSQCNFCFNHGWFVQAEAPPGAIFTKFREALIRDHKSQMGQRDVALYFVHWLTDLAGAEPSPLAGCDKFVTKFPLPVLNSFLRSFEFIEKIASHTETEVMEEYLKTRWMENIPWPGPLPTGDAAIARMRLLCMAQMNAPWVLRDWDELVDQDKDVLSLELSRTGCVGQSFSANLVPRDASSRLEGPAFLVYYGPAFLQNMGNDEAVKRLGLLAEIYRSARELWPAEVAKAAVNVTIRIDMIKSLSVSAMHEATAKGDVWLLVKHNETEAFVEQGTKRKLNKMIATSQNFQVLDLACLNAYDA